MHWLVRLRKAKIGEQGTKPTVCLDNAFVETVATRAGEVRWCAYQQAPVWSGSSHQPRPDLQSARLGQRCQKRRSAAAQCGRSNAVESLGEIRKLCGRRQRQPVGCSVEVPEDIVPVPYQLQIQGREQTPAIASRTGDRIAVTISTGRKRSGSRSIGPLRRTGLFDQAMKLQ